jgi:hypothetical protein
LIQLTRQVVYDDILHFVMGFSVAWKKLIQMNQRLPYRILDIGNLSLIIKECIDERANGYESLESTFDLESYNFLVVRLR